MDFSASGLSHAGDAKDTRPSRPQWVAPLAAVVGGLLAVPVALVLTGVLGQSDPQPQAQEAGSAAVVVQPVEETEPEAPLTADYSTVLDSYRAARDTGWTSHDGKWPALGILVDACTIQANVTGGPKMTHSSCVYAIVDLDGDGVDEMMMGAYCERGYTTPRTWVTAIYDYDENGPYEADKLGNFITTAYEGGVFAPWGVQAGDLGSRCHYEDGGLVIERYYELGSRDWKYIEFDEPTPFAQYEDTGNESFYQLLHSGSSAPVYDITYDEIRQDLGTIATYDWISL